MYRPAIVLGLIAVMLAGYIQLVELHGPSGNRVFVNPDEITSVREPVKADVNRHFAPGTHCLLIPVNGGFIAVRETCDDVLAAIGRPTP